MPPKKKVSGYINLQIQAGAATPAPPVGPALVMSDWITPLALTQPMATGAFTLGARVRLVLRCEDEPAPRCLGVAHDLIADQKYGLDTSTQAAVPTLRAGAVGLRAFAVPAAFEYLAVYVDP